MKKEFAYVEVTVPSGQTIQLRGRTFTEWETHEEQRFALMEELPKLAEAGKFQQAELTAQRAVNEMRKVRLTAWVKNFDGVKGGLTLRDVAEIERAALALEEVELPLGNSATGGSGQLTESGMNTAANAAENTNGETK